MRNVLPPELVPVRRRYSKILAIVSPPRCCSTALARVFWEHPEIAYYSHEPFEVTYFRREPLAAAAEGMLAPLALAGLARDTSRGARSLLIKEMPYQVGASFPALAALVTEPIVFLMRDPRLAIASRMRMKRQVGDDPMFPRVETGWELLCGQIEYCHQRDIPHVIVSAAEFRSRPFEVFPELFARLGLQFSERMLSWQACPEVDLDNLDGAHRHLYRKVLSSAELDRDVPPPPSLESFPTRDGLRQHVANCLRIYRHLATLPEHVGARGAPA